MPTPTSTPRNSNWTRGAVSTLFVTWLILGPARPAIAQSVVGDPSGGVPESGSLSLANALASTALDPSTGILNASLPFASPAARGASQPGLALTYSSTAGIREAGIGWGLNLPRIERQTLTGAPQYNDQLPPNAALDGFDRLVFDGEPLVPVCEVKANACYTAGPLPAWIGDGWVYFRLQADTTRARFFWSPDRKTWRVQQVGGEVIEFGQPLVQPKLFPEPLDSGIDYERVRSSNAPVQNKPYRWNIVRRFDAESTATAANVVAYRWARIGKRGLGFVTDVYDTPAARSSDTLTPASFAHHVRMQWESVPFLRGTATPGYRNSSDLRLTDVDVTSSSSESTARQLLRRYHLLYESIGNRYYLKSYELEGRCALVPEDASGTLPSTTCARLPATRLSYSERQNNSFPGIVSNLTLPTNGAAPFVVLDVNGDSLPDLLQTKMALSIPKQLVYFNHFSWDKSSISEPPSEE